MADMGLGFKICWFRKKLPGWQRFCDWRFVGFQKSFFKHPPIHEMQGSVGSRWGRWNKTNCFSAHCFSTFLRVLTSFSFLLSHSSLCLITNTSSNRTGSSFEEWGMCHCCGLSVHERSGGISSFLLSVKSSILCSNASICLHWPLAPVLRLQAPDFTWAVCLLRNILVLYNLFLVMEAFTRLSKKPEMFICGVVKLYFLHMSGFI